MPYYHWFYQGTYHANSNGTLPGPGATFGDTIKLAGRQLVYYPDTRTIKVDLEWDAGGWISYYPLNLVDAKIFVHLYDQEGNIIVQSDQRPGNGALPPANWLPGILRDTFTLTIPGDLHAGKYRVAVGMYDPVTNVRLHVVGEGSDQDNRLFIGAIEIPN